MRLEGLGKLGKLIKSNDPNGIRTAILRLVESTSTNYATALLKVYKDGTEHDSVTSSVQVGALVKVSGGWICEN
jgi:hypothetical protein